MVLKTLAIAIISLDAISLVDIAGSGNACCCTRDCIKGKSGIGVEGEVGGVRKGEGEARDDCGSCVVVFLSSRGPADMLSRASFGVDGIVMDGFWGFPLAF